MDSNGRLTRQQRRGVVLVTLLFICASAVLHMTIGGMVHPLAWKEVPAPSTEPLIIDVLQTPTPPPTPRSRPSPTPQPPTRTISSPRPIATSVVKPIAPIRPPIVIPTSRSTDGAGTIEASPEVGGVVTPAPSAPGDYRYIVVSARFIHRVQPDYPEQARTLGEEGTVIVTLTIGPDGISDVRVWESSGYADLDREALRAAKESTYSIPEVNGEPATETYRVIYTFSLNT